MNSSVPARMRLRRALPAGRLERDFRPTQPFAGPYFRTPRSSNMKATEVSAAAFALLSLVCIVGCSGSNDSADTTSAAGASGVGTGGQPSSAGSAPVDNPLTNPTDGPPAGNGEQTPVPAEAKLINVSSPDHVIGDGSKESCTGDQVVAAVAQGGVITFDCGPAPITIMMNATAKVFTDKPDVVLDGGGRVTLSGMGQRRILYMNTCDQAQGRTSARCDNQDFPHLTVQNLTFVDGNAKNEAKDPAGGAIFASGGRLKVLNSRFFNNVCADQGPDVGGGAVRAFQQYNGLP